MAVKKAELVRFLYKLDWPTETRNVQEVEYAFDDQQPHLKLPLLCPALAPVYDQLVLQPVVREQGGVGKVKQELPPHPVLPVHQGSSRS